MASDRVNLERALLAAIDDDDLPTADSLIRSGADVNRRGPLPLTALMLAAGRGSKITLETNGPDEQEAMDALVALINDYFGEGQ